MNVQEYRITLQGASCFGSTDRVFVSNQTDAFLLPSYFLRQAIGEKIVSQTICFCFNEDCWRPFWGQRVARQLTYV